MRLFSYTFTTMGCPASAKFYAKTKKEADSFFRKIVAEAERLDRKYSNYTSNSFTAEINRSAGNEKGLNVDEETAGLLDYAQECYEMSDGLFDLTAGALFKAWDFSAKTPRRPSPEALQEIMQIVGWPKVIWKRPYLHLPLKGMTLDFGGVVKEYAVDRIVGLCRENGFHHAIIELGGDLAAVGPHADGRPWNVGIRAPKVHKRDHIAIHLTAGAIASSGDYERCIEIDGKRLSHIINPLTGFPTQSVSSVSVLAGHCLVAGSLTTIAFLKGGQGANWLQEQETPYLFVTNEGKADGTVEFLN